MEKIAKSILTIVIAAGIVGLAGNTMQVNARLSSIEAQLKFLTENHPNYANK